MGHPVYLVTNLMKTYTYFYSNIKIIYSKTSLADNTKMKSRYDKRTCHCCYHENTIHLVPCDKVTY